MNFLENLQPGDPIILSADKYIKDKESKILESEKPIFNTQVNILLTYENDVIWCGISVGDEKEIRCCTSYDCRPIMLEQFSQSNKLEECLKELSTWLDEKLRQYYIPMETNA